MNNLTICQSICQDFQKMLSSETFLSPFREEKHFVRKRKLTMKQVICFLLHSSKRSMNLDLASVQEMLPSLSFPDVSKQAISKARKGIRKEFFLTLFRHATQQFYTKKKRKNTWHGYRLFAIDGTRIQVPCNAETIKYFGYAKNKKARIVTAMASASLFYDIQEDIIVDAILEPFESSERKAAKKHLDFLEEQGMQEQAVILCDRGYPSYEFYRRITEANYFFVMRIQENIVSLTKQNAKDVIVEYAPAHLKQEEKVKVRVIQIPLENGVTEYLVTNLLEETMPFEKWKELYFLRWGIESKYQELKSRLELESFTGACPIAVEQEFFLTMLFSNLAAMLKQETDQEIKKQTRGKKNQYQYQANRSYLLGRIKETFCLMLCGEREIREQLFRIVKEATKRRSQIQPGRKYERPKVQLQRKYFNNRKTCM